MPTTNDGRPQGVIAKDKTAFAIKTRRPLGGIAKKRPLCNKSLSFCVERSGSAESLNAVFHFAVAVAVIPLLLKRGGSEADGVFKCRFPFCFCRGCCRCRCR
jgi:hypothetical protein